MDPLSYVSVRKQAGGLPSRRVTMGLSRGATQKAQQGQRVRIQAGSICLFPATCRLFTSVINDTFNCIFYLIFSTSPRGFFSPPFWGIFPPSIFSSPR